MPPLFPLPPHTTQPWLTPYFSFPLTPPPTHHSLAATVPVLIGLSLLATLFLRSAIAALFLVTIAAASSLPAGSKSQQFRHSRVWDAWRRHFRLRASVPTLPYVDPAKNYMVVMVSVGLCVGGGAVSVWAGLVRGKEKTAR